MRPPSLLLAGLVLAAAPLMAQLAIVTDTLPDPVLGKPYTANIETSGAVGPVTWSFGPSPSPPPGFVVGRTGPNNATSGTLCYGAAVNSTAPPLCTGTVQGDAGIYNFVLRATDGASSVQKPFTFTLQDELRIRPAELPDIEVDELYSAQLIAEGGMGPYTWALVDLAFPPGIELNTSTGELSGTTTAPATGKAYFFKIEVTDSEVDSVPATRWFVINVPGALQITTAALLPPTIVNQAMTPITLQATGGTPNGWTVPTGWTLPEGLQLSQGDGVLSGTPTVAGSYRFPIQLSSSIDETVAKYFTLHVTLGPLRITQTSLPLAPVGLPYVATLTPTGGLPPYTWAFSTAATQGMQIDVNTGVITGTPLTTGSFPLPVTITDSIGTPFLRAFTFGVFGPLGIATTSLPNAAKGIAYNPPALAATGGLAPYFWSIAGALPPGLTLNSNTGQISGIPTTAGEFPFGISVTDFAQQFTTRQVSITVAPGIAISTTSLPDGTTGAAYSFTLTATGAEGPVNWAVASGAFPTGLVLNPATGAITGTPTEVGTFNFRIRASDTGSPSPAERTFVINIFAALVMSTTSLPNGKQTVAYSQVLTATGGKPPYTWSIATGTLPPGLTLVANRIEGTPTADGVFPFELKVTDSAQPQQTVTRPLSITVQSGISIVASPLADGITGTPYSQTLSATGAQGPVTWTVLSGLLPDGLFLSSAGVISGTPTTVGTANFTIRANDGVTTPAERAFSINIFAPLAISTATLPSGKQGVAYNQPLTATGGQPPYAWSFTGNLPPGLNLVADRIEGTPTTDGSFQFELKVTDSAQRTATRPLSITITSGIVIVTSSLADGVMGLPYSQTLVADVTVTWSIVGGGVLPAGLTLNAASGEISGTPTTAGTANFTIRATGAAPTTPVDRAFTITIHTPLSITTTSLPNGSRGVSYSQSLAATGGTAPYTWSLVTGTLPAGLTLSSATGLISGTPTAAGTSQFQVSVADSGSGPQTALASFSITIGESLTITTGNLSGTLGTAFSQTLAATGGVGPYTWAITSGALPGGLQLNASSGAITGTPTAAGAFNATFRVTDQAGVPVSKPLTITINPEPLVITTGNLSGTLGTAFSQTLAATGGVAPYSWAITSGTLPGGLQLNASSGAITGTPTAAGAFDATFRVTDQAQVAVSKPLTITINTAALPTVSFTSLPDSSPAARQPDVSVNLAQAYPADLTGTLTLTFASSVGGDDQTVQFSNGSRTLNFTIAAGATQAAFTGGIPKVLTGTVAGTLTITSQFSAGGQNVTPAPAPTKTIAVELAAPVISSVTLQRSGSTLTVVVTGYATSREMTSGVYRFSPASGSTLSQSDITVQLTNAFTTWFGSAAANATGGQFRLTVPFTIQGDATAVNLTSVTVTNTRGSSAAVGP